MSSDPRATEQANVPPRLADLPPRFWVMAVLTGIGAGLGAMLMMGVLRVVQHLAFSYHSGEYSAAASRHSDLRILLVLCTGGLVTGAGLWAFHRFSGGTGGDPTAVVWSHRGTLSLPRTLLSGALSEVTVALGGSIGREAAPQHTGAAVGTFISRRSSLPAEQRRLLIAFGAGAGLAAVYNVPFAGALFALEIYLGTMSLPLVAPALVTAGIATSLAWLTLPAHTVYSLPHLSAPTLSLMAFAVAVGPVIGFVSAGYVRAITWASDHRPTGLPLIVEPVVVFAALGALAFRYPLLLGNGVDLAQFAFTSSGALLTVFALAALKPLVTVACLRSGASGGLFTPTLSAGAITGALLGHLWLLVWPGSSITAYAVVGAVAMVAGAIEAPATAIAMIIELTGTVAVTAPAVLAVAGATIVSRHLNPLSVYSGRLPRGNGLPPPPVDGSPAGTDPSP